MKRFAYADPPYLGRAEYYRAHHADAMAWDKPETHQALIERLQAEYPDGWALSLSERSLRTILPMCPVEARTAAWCTDRPRYAGKAVPVRKHFEPVIFCGGRDYTDTGNRTADFIITKQEPLPAGEPRYAMNKGDLRSGQTFVGRKPAAFSLWLLDLLGWLPGDTIDDLFPGSGAVTAAWKTRQNSPAFANRPPPRSTSPGCGAGNGEGMMVAALYVAKDGCYFGLEGIDPWPAWRDARKYAGPHPVVAHPPCDRWCQMAPVNQARYGHAVGDDEGCFAAALTAVRRWGGVLEHPAVSLAWPAYDLPRPPSAGGWVRGACGGWAAHIEQRNYGHRARKATWLYAFGVDLPSLKWGKGAPPEAWISADRPRAELAARGIGQLSKREAKATPLEFRDLLISIARSARLASDLPEIVAEMEGR